MIRKMNEMNREQFIILGLIAISLIVSLFFIRDNGLYNITVLVSLFVIASVMFVTPKQK